MSVAITGDGPNIALTGSGSSFTITVTTGAGGGGAVDSVNGETGVVVLTADDVNARDVYRPAIVMSPATVTAFGGSMVNGVSVTIAALASSVPVGADLLIWNGTAGAAPNGSYTHAGSGTFNYSARQYLTSTSVANGCGLVESVDFYTAGSAADSSLWKLATANGTDWGLVAIGGYAFEVPILDAVSADTVPDEVNAVVREAPTRAFRCDGTDSGDWHTPHVGSFTGGYDFRAMVRPTYPEELAGEFYSEVGTQTRDSGVGTIDNHEVAILRADNGSNPSTTTDRPYLFFECTPTGESSEIDPRLLSALPSTWGDWIAVRVTVNFSTGVVAHWVQVGWEFNDTDTFDTTADGKTWWRIGTLTDVDYDSIDTTITEEWQLGHNFYGDIAWAEWYSGIDGTRIAAPDARSVTPGSASFVDAEGNTWTAQAAAKLVYLDLESGTYQPLDSDLTAIAALTPSNDDFVQRKAGAWTNRTVAQVRTDLKQANTLLHAETVASDAASKQYDVTGWAKVRVEFMGRSTRNGTTDTLLMTLNNNTGSVYSTDSAALTTSLALGTIPGINTNTDRLALVEAEIALLSGFLKGGYARATNYVSTATVGQAVAHRGLFSTITAEVTTLELKMSLGNIFAGARIRIIGLEPA